jgi:hypothetical protein
MAGPVRAGPVRAAGEVVWVQPYPDAGIFHLHSVVVLTMEGDRVSAVTNFIDSGVAPYFGLARTLPG